MRAYLPFTDYDFWAYFSAGSLVLFAIDSAFATGWAVHSPWTVVEIVVAVGAAYISGQLIAGVASAVLERILLRSVLGLPVLALMNVVTRSGPGFLNR